MQPTDANIKHDSESLLAIIGMGAALLTILPFAIYRLYQGNFTLGMVDSFLAIIIGLGFVQALRRKHVEYINVMLTLSYMGGLFAVLHLSGSELFYWAYPAVAATYFLLPVRTALPLNILCILATFPMLEPNMTTKELMGVYPTLILLCVMGYIFSARSEYQKQRLSHLVTEDALTNTENRRSLDLRLDEIVANQNRVSQNTSMLMLDLDHFKRINDTHGHTIGDKILISFAHLIKANIRVTDRLYRFGGEEFVLIANNTNLESAGKLAEFIRKLVENDQALSRYDVTVSIGVAEISDIDDRDTWLHRTDVALYEAKEAGRNQSCMARPSKGTDTYVFEKVSYFRGKQQRTASQNTVVSMQSYTQKKDSGRTTTERTS